MSGALALHRRAECENDFFKGGVTGAFHQSVDGEIVRPDAVKRRKDSAQDVIARVDGVRPFEGPKVGDVRHHHDGRFVSPRIGAERARILRVDIAADPAN